MPESHNGEAFVAGLSQRAHQVGPTGRSLRAVPFGNLPMRPGDPGWNKLIPPPEPDEALLAAAAALEAAPTKAVDPPNAVQVQMRRHIVVSYGPTAGSLIVSVKEQDWTISASAKVPKSALGALLPVLRALAPIADLTAGGLNGPEPAEDR